MLQMNFLQSDAFEYCFLRFLGSVNLQMESEIDRVICKVFEGGFEDSVAYLRGDITKTDKKRGIRKLFRTRGESELSNRVIIEKMMTLKYLDNPKYL